LLASLLRSASYASGQHDTARIRCRAPTVQQSIHISCLSGPQRQTRLSGVRWPNDWTDGQTDRRTLDNLIHPAPHAPCEQSQKRDLLLLLLLKSVKFDDDVALLLGVVGLVM